jgi:hypothetical protein
LVGQPAATQLTTRSGVTRRGRMQPVTLPNCPEPTWRRASWSRPLLRPRTFSASSASPVLPVASSRTRPGRSWRAGYKRGRARVQTGHPLLAESARDTEPGRIAGPHRWTAWQTPDRSAPKRHQDQEPTTASVSQFRVRSEHVAIVAYCSGTVALSDHMVKSGAGHRRGFRSRAVLLRRASVCRPVAEFRAHGGISLGCHRRMKTRRVPLAGPANAHAGRARNRTPAFGQHSLTSKDTPD